MKTISLDLRERILTTYDTGEATRAEVGQRFRVSEAMVKKLNEAANTATSDPGVIERLRTIGFHAAGGKPDDLQKFVASDTATFRRIAREARIQLQ